MLENGGYPYYLKQRIKSDNGHLGNCQTSVFLADTINDNLSHICFAHLSKNNNTPEKALETFKKIISERGLNLKSHQQITILNRHTPSEMIRIIE